MKLRPWGIPLLLTFSLVLNLIVATHYARTGWELNFVEKELLLSLKHVPAGIDTLLSGGEISSNQLQPIRSRMDRADALLAVAERKQPSLRDVRYRFTNSLSDVEEMLITMHLLSPQERERLAKARGVVQEVIDALN